VIEAVYSLPLPSDLRRCVSRVAGGRSLGARRTSAHRVCAIHSANASWEESSAIARNRERSKRRRSGGMERQSGSGDQAPRYPGLPRKSTFAKFSHS
jgi:hypothetical protein